MTDYNDYLIALSPSENMVDQLKRFKYFSFEKIGEYDGYDSKPDIIIQQWPNRKAQWVEPLLPKLERDLKTLPSIVLDINGFDLLNQDNQPGIYAKIENTAASMLWFNKLGDFFNTSHYIPHIPIASNLSPDAFQELWPCFKHTNWNARIVIDKLSILKRSTIGYNRNFKLFKQIPFNPNLNFFDYTDAQLSPSAIALNAAALQQISLF